jgi:hypothetical protein
MAALEALGRALLSFADALFLRRVEPGRESYRVILKDASGETELGSIGTQHATGGTMRWVWGIDTVIPMREADQTGSGADRKDCMKRFQAAWDRFASDPANLAEFMRYKRQRRP